MNTLEGFKDFDKVRRPIVGIQKNATKYTIPSITVNLAIWMTMNVFRFNGIFEINDFTTTYTRHKFRCQYERIEHFKPILPFAAIIRLDTPKFNADPVLTKVVGMCRDNNGKLLVELKGRTVLCYNPPVAGSKGGEKPEPQ